MGTIEQRLRDLDIILPDFGTSGYYGANYGTMKAHHQVGKLLFLSGHVPEQNGIVVHAGKLGENVSIEQGYAAARLTAINCLAGIKYAIGDLDRVAGIVRTLCFVACTPSFHDVHRVPVERRICLPRCSEKSEASAAVPRSAL